MSISNKIKPDNEAPSRPSGLMEFEAGSAIGLEQFEEGSTISLDDFVYESPILLEEFEESLDVVFLNEIVGQESTEEPDPFDDIPNEIEKINPGIEPDGSWEPDGEALPYVKPEVDRGIGQAFEPPSRMEPNEKERKSIPGPIKPVIGFICKHAANNYDITKIEQNLSGGHKVELVILPCSGMLKPAWLKYVLDKGASGAFVVSCAPGSCQHRTGADIMHDRLLSVREPILAPDTDQRRLRLFWSHSVIKDDLQKKIDSFLAELNELDAAGTDDEAETKPSVEKKDNLEMDDWVL
jgi:coenzyme F420-reducing hydrogenase delta subunit